MSVNSTMYIGTTGLTSFAQALSMTADNVANANTTGFKASHACFGDMVSSYLTTQGIDTDRAGAGSAIIGVATNFAQGSLSTTETWSDIAINGDGFFAVHKLIDGALDDTAQTYYTRDGGFHVNDEGLLVNNQGLAVLDSEGAAIPIDDPATPVYYNYNIDSDGQIWGTPIDPAGGTAPQSLGLIGLSTFPNQDGLIRQGANLYLPGPESGNVVTTTVAAKANVSIVDCSVEASNVDLATEMVNMIIYQADYNANSKSITTGSTMLDTVINMVR